MPGWGEALVALAVVVGLVGVVVQVLPGAFLVAGAVVTWGVLAGGPWGWTAVTAAVLLTVAGQVAKWVLAGRHLQRAGVPNRSLLWGGLLGVVGFVVVPVVGLVLGFVLGTYLAELARLREGPPAWRATVAALQATGLTILVELAAALLVTGVWALAVWRT
ncbi:DUF456 domain-containing protein [Cellulomonas marina]|uniref:DUF456 domain-containing protein n=1 Tax=Cellulomonas marina TaxID=988821 RepID=A0A1I1A0A8_9CELL|nr:DUF456 domain-containing protein [Cellulomonas marina]GIG30294.1 hypothetical protein Cma02nite_28940 [Cellulomonas marina]SFB31414.1 hypothetical protein SAMN05421867_11418 [Cellulomonas marina]